MNTVPLYKRVLERDMIASFSIMGLRLSMLASKFLLALFIVRFIGLEAMGIFGLVSGACAVIPMVMRGGIFSNLARQAVHRPRADLTKDLRHYMTGVLALYALIALPLTLAIGFHFGMPGIAALCLAVIFFEHAGIDIFVTTNNLGRPRLANVLLSLQASLWIFIYMGVAYAVPSLRDIESVFAFWALAGAAMTGLSFFLTLKWPWKEAFSAPMEKGWHAAHIKKSWRIYLSEMTSSGTIYLDRYLIGIFLSIEMVGVYVLFWQVTNAICNLVGAGILQVYTPRLVQAHNSNDDAAFNILFNQSAVKSLGVTFALGLGAAIVVPLLITFTNNAMALDYLPLLWAMLAALMFRVGADIYAYALYARHRDDLVFHSTVLKLCVAAVTTVVFLQYWNIYGVVPASVLTGGAAILYAMIAWKGKKAL